MNNKTAGHTPEKWEVRMIGKEVTVAVVGSEKIIAFVETEENARLIAAVPELLEECKKNLWWLQHVRSQIQGPKNVMLGFDQAIKYLGIVIAKAEGR